MARELTGKQKAFLQVLFDEAGGNMVTAKKMAGYSDTSSTAEIVKGLKEEILEATQMYMAQNAPKAAMAMTGALYDPTALGNRDRIAASREILDRTGIVKTERITVKTDAPSLLIFPPKSEPTYDEDDDDALRRN